MSTAIASPSRLRPGEWVGPPEHVGPPPAVQAVRRGRTQRGLVEYAAVPRAVRPRLYFFLPAERRSAPYVRISLSVDGCRLRRLRTPQSRGVGRCDGWHRKVNLRCLLSVCRTPRRGRSGSTAPLELSGGFWCKEGVAFVAGLLCQAGWASPAGKSCRVCSLSM